MSWWGEKKRRFTEELWWYFKERFYGCRENEYGVIKEGKGRGLPLFLKDSGVTWYTFMTLVKKQLLRRKREKERRTRTPKLTETNVVECLPICILIVP